MKTHLFLLLLLILSGNLLAQPSEGGKEIGNGGDVVVCKNDDGSIKSIELLDFFEARTLKKLNYNLGPNNLSVENKIMIALKRLEHFSSERAKLYREQADILLNDENETSFVANTTLTDIPDSLHLALPNGCDIEQIAIQNNPIFSDDPRYVINQDLWNRLDNNNKAGLVLHEIIYREAIKNGHTNSIRTRRFNALLSSDKIENYNTAQLIELLANMDMFPLGIFTFKGSNYYFEALIHQEISFYSNGQLKCSGRIGDQSSIIFKNKEIKIYSPKFTNLGECPGPSFYQSGNLEAVRTNTPVMEAIPYKNETNHVLVAGSLKYTDSNLEYGDLYQNTTLNFETFKLNIYATGKHIVFWPNGMIKTLSGYLNSDALIPLGNNSSISFPAKSGNLNFYSNGIPRLASLSDITNVVVQDKNIPVISLIEFYENGIPRFLRLAKNAKLKNANGDTIIYKKHTYLTLNENGLVIKAAPL